MIAREEVITKAQDPMTIQPKLQELELAQAVSEPPPNRNDIFVTWPKKFQIHCCRSSRNRG